LSNPLRPFVIKLDADGVDRVEGGAAPHVKSDYDIIAAAKRGELSTAVSPNFADVMKGTLGLISFNTYSRCHTGHCNCPNRQIYLPPSPLT
jgi:hypothetical protein